jgi:hypothetical protein
MKSRVMLLWALLATSLAGAQSYLDCHFIPGWEQSGSKRQYDSSNLSDYKDGGAEGYLIFGFIRMTGIDCKSGPNTLVIVVSEMTGVMNQHTACSRRVLILRNPSPNLE